MKRILSGLLALILCLTLIPTTVFAVGEEEELYSKANQVLQEMRSTYAGQTVEQTGVSKETYADTIAKCLAAYSSTNNLPELTDYMTLDSTMQSYSRVISSMAVLVNEGDVTKYKDYDPALFSDHDAFVALYVKFMTDALDHMIDHAGVGLDFATVELCMSYILTRDVIPAETTEYWKTKLGEIKGTVQGQEGGWYKISSSSQDNRASYVAGAEQIRDYLGLVDAESYLDTSFSKMKRKFTSNGMWRDANTEALANPFLYDYTVRAHLTLADYFGYEGEYAANLKDWLRKGGISTLLLQASNGEIPYGGRSNQYIFNEVLLASSCEYEANYYKSVGDDYLAGVFKRSAHLAVQSIQDCLNEKKHIKNMMTDAKYGTDAYGNFDKYMASMSSFLSIGYFFADDSIQEVLCPAEVGGFVAQENEMFSTVVANCGGYTIELLTVANQTEDSIGMSRIIKDGVPAALGLSSSFTGQAAFSIPDGTDAWYSFDVAWKNAEGNMVKLSDFHDKPQNVVLQTEVNVIEESKEKVVFSVKYSGNMDGVSAVVETYTLTADGLQVDAELIDPVGDTTYFTVPLLDTNGDMPGALAPDMKATEQSVTLTAGENAYTVSSDGTFVDDGQKLYNRNGIYNATHFEKSGSKITVNASLGEKPVMEKKFNVKATADKIQLTFSGYTGDGATADVYMMAPYEYHYLDEHTGYDTSTIVAAADLNSVGTVALDGEEHTVEIDRYVNGVDQIYHKFYLADSNTIYQGPMWITDIDVEKAPTTINRSDNIKGIAMQASDAQKNHALRLQLADDVGAETAKIDVIIDKYLADNTQPKPSKAVEFVASDGQTYYFKKSGTINITRLDGVILRNAEAGIRTTLIVTLQAGDNTPAGLVPAGATELGKQDGDVIGMDTSNPSGMGHFIAFFEYIASLYGDKIDAIVLGNEIDFPYAWNANYDYIHKGMPALDDYVEEYYRNLRLATLAVQKYTDDVPVLVPFTHYWATTGNNLPAALYNEDAVYSYAPKDILDVLFEKTKAQGDFNWGIAPHPYAISLVQSDPLAFDLKWKQYVTGDQDTAFLTFANLEVLDEYLHQEDHLFEGKVRPVHMTESGIQCEDATDMAMQQRQAASIAYIYYKASLLESVKAWPYLHSTDGSVLHAGLMTDDNKYALPTDENKRLSYDVWKDIGAISYDEFDNKYAPYISSLALGDGVESYRELLIKAGDAFGSHYDWDAIWRRSLCKDGHGIVQHKDRVEPTYEADGNIEYWYCERCGFYFEDEAMTKETDQITLSLSRPENFAMDAIAEELKLTAEDSYLEGFAGGEKTADVLSEINKLDLADGTVQFLNSDGTVTTGTVLQVTYPDGKKETATIVIRGDVNGDGKVTALDYVAIRNHIMDARILTDGAKLLAADINKDTRVTAEDYVKAKNIIMSRTY